MDKTRPIVVLTAFYKPFSSGAELCVEEMVARRDGRELLIVTSRLSRKSSKRDEDQGVHIIRVGFGYSWDKFLYPFFCIWPTLRAKPKIVHAVMESYAGIGLVFLKWIKPSLRTVLTLQSGNLDVDPKLSKGPLAWIWKKIHTVPDRVTAISGFLAKRATAIRGSDESVSIVPNGVDTSVARGMSKERVPGRVVCISRLSREKGVDVLIKAFSKVANQMPGSELHIVGDGPDRAFVESLIAENNLQSRVKLYGHQPHDEAIRIVSTGQVFALLSRGEGQGIVLLEAASAGLPCVATNVGGIPEAMIDGQTGYLVPNEDADEATKRIVEILCDNQLRDRMGAAAEEFSKKFEWSACIAQYHELWNGLESKMKLVIATGIYPPEIGGPAGYAKRLSQALADKGHGVTVVTYGDEKTEQGPNKIICHSEGSRSDRENLQNDTASEALSESVDMLFNVIVVKRSGGVFVRYVRYAWHVWRQARQADLVYLQDTVSCGLPGSIGAALAGTPTMLKVVGDYAWEQYQQTDYVQRTTSNVQRGETYAARGAELLDEFLTHKHAGKIGWFEKIERWVAKRAKAIIVPSKYLKTVVEKWGIDSGKVNVVYNSIEPLPETEIPLNLPLTRETSDSESPLVKEPALSGTKWCRTGGLGDFRSGNRKIILTVVRAVPWKGGDFLCDCLKDLPPDFVLVVAGDGPCLEEWKKHTQEIGVAERVLWLGRLSRAEVAEWYRRADVFVLATGYEGFPHVVVEAASVGLHCLVSDQGGNPETKEMFPDLVTVLPYKYKQAWVEAINSPSFPPLPFDKAQGGQREGGQNPAEIRTPPYGKGGAGVSYGALDFVHMVQSTESVLKNVV